MTAYAPRHAFDVYREPQPSLIALLFRRIVAAMRRKPAVPEIPSPASGAATALLTAPLSADMDTSEFAALDAKVDAVIRPVNGRYLGTQPRRHPELPETFDNRPGREVLERVLAGLRAMPVQTATYRGGWQ